MVSFCVIGVVTRAIPHFGSLMSFQVFVALYFALYGTQHTDTAVVLIGLSLTFLFVGMMVVGKYFLT